MLQSASTPWRRLQEKAELQAKLDDAEQRANDFALLATKLSEAIEARQRDIATAELAAGKEYRDDDAGTSIMCAPALPVCPAQFLGSDTAALCRCFEAQAHGGSTPCHAPT